MPSFVALGELVETIMGQAPPGNTCNDIGNGVPFVKAGEFSDERPIIREWTTKPLRMAKRSDVLLCVVGATCGKLNLGEDCAIGRSVSAIRPLESKINQKYLYYFLQRKTEKLRMGSQGSAQGVITRGMIEELLVPDITLKEQKRIATILDKTDAIRRKRQKAIQLADQFLRSVFLNMFSDNNQLMSIQELLDKEYLLLHKDGNHGGNYPRKHEFCDVGIPFISAKDVSDDDGSIDYSKIAYLNESKARKLTIGWLEKGDVLLAHNATVGRVGLFDGEVPEALIGTSLTAFRPNTEKLSSQYLFCALKYSVFQQQLKKNMGQSTRNQVPITTQKELMIPVGDIKKQKEIENIFRKVSSLKRYSQDTSDYAQTLFASLSQKAFSGEL